MYRFHLCLKGRKGREKKRGEERTGVKAALRSLTRVHFLSHWANGEHALWGKCQVIPRGTFLPKNNWLPPSEGDV